MIIGIQDYILYGLILLSFFLIIALLALYFSLKKNAPDAFVYRAALAKGMPICMVHYRGRRAVPYLANIDKLEKDMGTPYWTVPDVGIKFKPGADDIEMVNGGKLACAHYYTNLTESISIQTAVAFSQLKEFFGKKLHLPIDTIEDVAMYTAADYIKTGDKQRALDNAKINSAETKNYVLKYLTAVDANRAELEKMKLESGVFTFQTAMKALDSTVAWTSSHAEHMKKVVRAAALREAEDANARKREIIYMAIAAFIVVIAAVSFIIGIR